MTTAYTIFGYAYWPVVGLCLWLESRPRRKARRHRMLFPLCGYCHPKRASPTSSRSRGLYVRNS